MDYTQSLCTHVELMLTDDLTSAAALVRLTACRLTFSRVPFLGLSDFSQGNLKVKHSILKSVIPAHLLLLAGLKQTIKLNMIVCETMSHGGLDDFREGADLIRRLTLTEIQMLLQFW